MGPMIGLWLPDFIHPDINPLNFAVVQIILTTPVMIIGYSFFKVGFKTLFKLNPIFNVLLEKNYLTKNTNWKKDLSL